MFVTRHLLGDRQLFDLTNFFHRLRTTMFVDEADNVSRDGTEHLR